ARLAVVESLIERGVGKDVPVAEAGEFGLVANLKHVMHDGVVLDAKHTRRGGVLLDGLPKRQRVGRELARVLMKPRRQQPELAMLDAEALAAFVDASFSQDDRL